MDLLKLEVDLTDKLEDCITVSYIIHVWTFGETASGDGTRYFKVEVKADTTKFTDVRAAEF